MDFGLIDKSSKDIKTNMRLKNPVIGIPYNKELLDEMIPALLTIANFSGKGSNIGDVVAVFKKHKELYKKEGK